MTSEEIVRVLRGCAVYHDVLCKEIGCELADKGEGVCRDILEFTAAGLIERLEKEKAALMEIAKKSARCEQCANYRPRRDAVDCNQCAEDCPCQKCKRGSKWEWKGVDSDEADLDDLLRAAYVEVRDG